MPIKPSADIRASIVAELVTTKLDSVKSLLKPSENITYLQEIRY